MRSILSFLMCREGLRTSDTKLKLGSLENLNRMNQSSKNPKRKSAKLKKMEMTRAHFLKRTSLKLGGTFMRGFMFTIEN